MITTRERQAAIQLVKPKNDSLRARPVVIKWKGRHMVRNHSFLATVREIITWSLDSDVTKVGIVGKPDSGKSTLAEGIGHFIHKYSKIPFAVRIFKKQHLLNFKETLNTLHQSGAANYVLVFDDVSFLGADANKKQVDMIKQAETTIRHLPGGQDVKIILIYNYHYTLGLDKYLRQADFYYFTSVGSEERDNVMSIVGKGAVERIEEFRRIFVSAKSRKYWSMIIGPKEPFVYRYRNPFIPVLFWNNESVRFIVTPTRQFADPICGICDSGIKSSNDGDTLEQIIKRGETNFGVQSFKAAIKLKLFINGLTVYGKHVVRSLRYIDKALVGSDVTLENMANYYKFDITKTKMRLKPDDPLYGPPSN